MDLDVRFSRGHGSFKAHMSDDRLPGDLVREGRVLQVSLLNSFVS